MARHFIHTESKQIDPVMIQPGVMKTQQRKNLKVAQWLRSAPVALVFWVGAAFLISWLVLPKQESPWIWLALIWAGALTASAFYLRHVFLRIVCINLAAVIFALGIGELWFAIAAIQAPEQTYTGDYIGDYFVDHALLGYGPKPDYAATAGLTVNGRQIYDTSYSINLSGLRITPQTPNAESSVLFFGGSFTFGEGVSDNQSMPFEVGHLIGSEIKVHNFGFHGYGPHQMLAALESGLVDSIVSQPARVVVYQAIDSHVPRAAGRAFWDFSGPRYVLTETGDAELAGHFDEGHGEFRKWLFENLNTSHMYQQIFGVNSAVSDADISLFVAIVSRSRDLLKVKYPAVEFHVLLWGYSENENFVSLHDALMEKGITVHSVSDILPEYETNPGLYQIDADDTHPNALAHEIIALYVADKIIAVPEE